jgi:hypothetical protein
MESAERSRESSLKQLDRLVKLAERLHLYLDLTGLGCYHKQDVPAWYDQLDEKARWNAQSRFWEAIAERCKNSPAIFCYDLMNEPVVPGDDKRDDWLGGALAGKHFVQFITLSAAGRPRHEVARDWIDQLVAAIRKHDGRGLVTVGLVPWSLDRPGLTSGFDPKKTTDALDFIAMHIYPETGKIDAALETVKGFAAVGKPVVIEEIFPLRCDARQLSAFIDQSKGDAAGWIGFYWGKSPEELRPAESIRDAIFVKWLDLFEEKGKEIAGAASFGPVKCEGAYENHLQGVCTNNGDAIYWSFTTALVKTDAQGKVVKQIPVANHHGDLCHHAGKIFVAVNLGEFNQPAGKADSWVYVYSADDLSLLTKHSTPEAVHGAGGIAYHDRRFIVVGGLPEGIEENYVFEYDADFKFVKKHAIASGHTKLGIQTAEFAEGRWRFGCYGDELLVTDEGLKLIGKYGFECSYGVVSAGPNRYLIGRGSRTKKGRTGEIVVAHGDEEKGLIVDGAAEAK